MRYTHVCFSRARLHVHGCNTGGCEPDGRMTEFSRTFRKGFLARIGDDNGHDTPETQRDGDGGAGSSDGGVRHEEYERVRLEMCTFLAGVGSQLETSPLLTKELHLGKRLVERG